MDLPNKYKLFWLFLITDCDHVGIWQVNYKVASFYVGDHLEPAECERILKDRIIKINDGKYWFIPKFIEFQYGVNLSTKNRALISVIENLKKNDLLKFLPGINIKEAPSKELTSSLEAAKDKDKDKDKDKVKDKDLNEENENAESIWRGIYLSNPGKVEIDFVKELIHKHGATHTKRIIYSLRENGFKKVATMRKALDGSGNIIPRDGPIGGRLTEQEKLTRIYS